MNTPFDTLQPTQLWQHFYSLTQIPRPSGHTEKVRQFLVDFGKKLGLEALTDKAGNVLIRKPATAGMENRKPVILQAHMDMVPQKNTGIGHDFEKDPLQVFVDGDWVKAKDTTLGADNGIGVAAALAVLESKELVHGSIEAFFTMDEETGMFGAFGLKKGFLKGNILLNLDSEQEGELFVGCAGGMDADITFRFMPEELPEGDVALKVSLTGLLGGHSGLDIQQERANANKLMIRFLKIAVAEYEARLASISGGSLRNAIPREAFAVITVPSDGVQDIIDLVSETEDLFNEEYEGLENNICLSVETVSLPEFVLPEEVQDDLINAIYGAPNGVFRHIPQIPSVVETSNNLAIVQTEEKKITIKYLIRSAVESKKYELCSMLESVYSLAGAKVEFVGGYPAWQPNFDSPILKEMKEIYQRKWSQEPVVKVIHAGLECGILGATEPHLDMISFGPTVCHPHSPDEKVNIPSVLKFWYFLIGTLENIPTKE